MDRQISEKVCLKFIEDGAKLEFYNFRYYAPIFLLVFCIPIYGWMALCGTPLYTAIFYNCCRHMLWLHVFYTFNIFSHTFGLKPFDKSITAVDILRFSRICFSECFHNFHHTFPWDYRSFESDKFDVSFADKFIEFCAWIGL